MNPVLKSDSIHYTLNQIHSMANFAPDRFLREITEKKWMQLVYNGVHEDREKLRHIRKFYFSKTDPKPKEEPFIYRPIAKRGASALVFLRGTLDFFQ